MSQPILHTHTRSIRGLVKIEYTLRNETGLLIKMPVSTQTYRIGGADSSPMITRKRYSLDDENMVELEVPYIPGSSLKGRIRALLELSLGLRLYTTDNKIWSHVRILHKEEYVDEFIRDVKERDVVCELFGWAATNYQQIVDALSRKIEKELREKGGEKAGEDGKIREKAIQEAEREARELYDHYLASTRLLFSDLFPSVDYIKNNNISSILDFLEDKAENRIDRITSAADPRDIVRVRPGVEFKGELTLLLFDNDKEMIEKYLSTIVLGFELLEKTYLGNSGSRGYGRVRLVDGNIVVYKIDSQALELKESYKKGFHGLEGFKKIKSELVNKLKELY